jgi:hypothetical protein
LGSKPRRRIRRQVGAAYLDGQACQGGFFGFVGQQAAGHAAFEEVELVFVEAQQGQGLVVDVGEQGI